MWDRNFCFTKKPGYFWNWHFSDINNLTGTTVDNGPRLEHELSLYELRHRLNSPTWLCWRSVRWRHLNHEGGVLRHDFCFLDGSGLPAHTLPFPLPRGCDHCALHREAVTDPYWFWLPSLGLQSDQAKTFSLSHQLPDYKATESRY